MASAFSELFTLEGATSGSATTGTFSLYTDFEQGTAATYFRIPKSCCVKVWGIRVNSNQTQVQIQYSTDVSSGTPSSPTNISLQDLAAAGTLELEKRRPIVLRSQTGKEGFQVNWTQSVATVAQMELDVECTDDTGLEQEF